MPFLAAIVPALVEGVVATGVGLGTSVLLSHAMQPPGGGGGGQPFDPSDILNPDGGGKFP